MGRTDAWALNLPEPPPVMPEAQSASQTAGAQLLEMLGRRPDSTKLLEAVKAASGPPDARVSASAPSASVPAAARATCPSCKASMTAVEQKLERCLTCGTSFSAGDVKVSVGI